MDKSIESGCKPTSLIEPTFIDDGEFHLITYDIGRDAARIANEINIKRDKLVLDYLTTKTLTDIKRQIEEELKRRNLDSL